MIYLYIDIDGKVGKSESRPTLEDIASSENGELQIIRLEQDGFGNVFPEELTIEDGERHWYDLPQATLQKEEGKEFHVI